MSVPNFEKFIGAFLKVVGDGKLYSSKDIKDPIAKELNISELDRNERTSGGKDTKFNNRIYWARKYLDAAGLIETPLRAKYRITEEGIKALNSGETIDFTFLKKFEKFKAFQSVTDNQDNTASIDVSNDEIIESPIEILENTFQKVNSLLANQLMEEVMKLSCYDFEKLVVKLLLHMGYGNGIDGAGTVTQKSKDGGIDGIIKEDQLGFSQIYIQAKQWDAKKTSIDKPEMHKFLGALLENKAQKGLFITTSKFSSGAVDSAKSASNAQVVLIDGPALAKLMIKYNVGVSVEHVYEVKRIDTDFFIDEF